MRNIILFVPVVMLLNFLLQLSGVIAAQPVVETVLAVFCLVMYAKDSGKTAIQQQSKAAHQSGC